MYIYKKNVVMEALTTKQVIKEIYLINNFKDQEILTIIKRKNIKYKYVSKMELDKLISDNHQGIVALIDNFKTYDIDYLRTITKPNPLILMLDHLEDPHNMGAIIRTSVALGVDAIIIPNIRSVEINQTVIKVSAGACFHIPIIKVSNLVNCVNSLKQQGYWIASSTMIGSNVNEFDANCPLCLVVGNEGQGVSKLLLKQSDYNITIPMTGLIDSLNVSVATGIIINTIINNRK